MVVRSPVDKKINMEINHAVLSSASLSGIKNKFIVGMEEGENPFS